MSKELVGINLLKYAVQMLNSNREDFNQRFTADELIRIATAVQACDWDIYPDKWTEQQVQECLQFGVVPQWEVNHNNDLTPVYMLKGEKFLDNT